MRFIEYKESRIHGTKDFPFAYYYVTPEHPRYHMQYHWHHEYEIIHIFEGIFHLLINGREFQLHAGDSAFIESGCLHGGNPEQCSYSCIVFDLDSFLVDKTWASDIYELISTSNLHIQPFYSSDMTLIQNHITTMCNGLAENYFGYRFSVIGALCELLSIIMKEHYYSSSLSTTNCQRNKILQIKTVLSFIAKNYSEDITLADMAACATLNKNYFCKAFREIMHKTPIDYLNFYRIESACEQLATTSKSITEIALDCGYHDSGYFVKAFKKYKGVVPSKYHLELPN